MERKEAIEVVRKNRPHVSESGTQFETALRTLVPELAESEDELMRKEAISIIKQYNIICEREGDKCYTADRVIAWLEKQDEKKPVEWSGEEQQIIEDAACVILDCVNIADTKEEEERLEELADKLQDLKPHKQGESIDKEKVKISARKDLALSIISYLDDNRVAGCMNLSSMECEDIEDACVNSKWTKLYNYMKKKLETPDVSDYNPYEATVKSIIAMTERYANGNDLRDFYDNVKVKCKEAVDYDKTWLEKTSRQEDYNSIDPHFGKPIGEVGVWFAVGDWAAANRANFRSPVKIVDISDTEYRIEDTKGNSGVPKIDYFDSRYHLWSIADAKDGDVLISACNQPFIYNGYNDSFYVGSYGGIAAAGGFKVSVEECRWTENISIHPATKEQQNYLFQKMKEAGYMWDSYTKSVFCSTNM